MKKVVKFLIIVATLIVISVIIIKIVKKDNKLIVCIDNKLFDKNIESYAKAIANGIIENLES